MLDVVLYLSEVSLWTYVAVSFAARIHLVVSWIFDLAPCGMCHCTWCEKPGHDCYVFPTARLLRG